MKTTLEKECKDCGLNEVIPLDQLVKGSSILPMIIVDGPVDSAESKIVNTFHCSSFVQGNELHGYIPRRIGITSMHYDVDGDLNTETFDFLEMSIERCAKIIHEVNRAYCISRGDLSQVAYDFLYEEAKDSLRQGIRNVIRNKELTAEESHNNWYKLKIESGWKYGTVKDVEKKEHPDLVPYYLLPVAEKSKNEIFVTLVKLLML